MNELALLITSDWSIVSTIIILSYIIKDLTIELSLGLIFFFDKDFSEGDKLIIDDQRAIILKIGMRYSVFEITKYDGTVTWMYIPNSLVKKMALEKIIKE